MITLEDKCEILIRDYGLDRLLMQNDLTEEKVLGLLVEWGLIDLAEYFYTDTDELILNNED